MNSLVVKFALIAIVPHQTTYLSRLVSYRKLDDLASNAYIFEKVKRGRAKLNKAQSA